MRSLKEILDEARMVATGDYKISASGRKVRRLIKIGDDDYNRADDIDKDGDVDADDMKRKKMTRESVDELDEVVRVYDVSKSNQGVKPKTPEERNKAAAVVKAARANKPKDNYTGKSVTGAGSAGAGQRQAGKTATHIAVKESQTNEEVEQIDEISDKTLGNYIDAARKDREKNKINKAAPDSAQRANANERDKKRIAGMNKAKSYLTPGTAGHAKNQARRAANEQVEQIDEAVSVKKDNYSWGKMVTVHHGADTSYPLHPEHQEKIKNLKDGEHTSFTDETNRKVKAHREGENVHLTHKDTSRKTTVSHSHFTEALDYDKIRSDAADHLQKSINKQSDDRIAALKNPKKPESFLAKVGRKQINMVKGAWHGLTKESKDDVPFDGPYSKPTDTVTDKSGAKHTAMSRARHLARMAAQQQQKKAKK